MEWEGKSDFPATVKVVRENNGLGFEELLTEVNCDRSKLETEIATMKEKGVLMEPKTNTYRVV